MIRVVGAVVSLALMAVVVAAVGVGLVLAQR